MRIQKINYINHPIMGDLSLSFVDENGKTYDTVVFAGENGTGKTTILQTISSICTRLDQHCKIECKLDEQDRSKLRELGFTYEIKNNTILLIPSEHDGAVADVEYRLITENQHREIIWPNLQSNGTNLVANYLSTIIIKFKTNNQEPNFQDVDSTTKLTIDESRKNVSNRILYANQLNASELLVNITSQDATELLQKVRNGNEVSTVDAENRILRFRTAFDNFFDNQLKFLEVENFKIWFQKGSNKFEIGKLSSGEKTIVQYGAFFLKDQNANETFITLIDEPEQSLHPHWEDKILQYYKDILTKDEQQLSQAFVTTHSEYVIRDAYEANDLIIILKRNENGKIEAISSLKLNLFPSSPTYNEIKYSAFDLITPDFHSELFDFLQKTYKEQGQLSGDSIGSLDMLLSSDATCPTTRGITPNLRNDRTLPVYIRNFIDHPSGETNGAKNRRKYEDTELKTSIEYLINKIRALPTN